MEKQDLSENVVRMVLEAPAIARKRRAGQFIILKIDEKGERIPLTIVDSDAEKGTITIIFQVVGKTTAVLAKMKAGDSLSDVQGPLGNPTEIENFGHVVCIGGGVGRRRGLPARRGAQEGGKHRDLHHRGANEGAAHPRGGDEEGQRPADRGHGRRELRIPRVRQRGPPEPDRRGGEDRPRLCDRPGADDARPVPT